MKMAGKHEYDFSPKKIIYYSSICHTFYDNERCVYLQFLRLFYCNGIYVICHPIHANIPWWLGCELSIAKEPSTARRIAESFHPSMVLWREPKAPIFMGKNHPSGHHKGSYKKNMVLMCPVRRTKSHTLETLFIGSIFTIIKMILMFNCTLHRSHKMSPSYLHSPSKKKQPTSRIL